MKPLTPKERVILDFIEAYQKKNKVPPTYVEIQEKFEYKALSSVQQFVAQLTRKGHLKPPVGKSQKRALELVSTQEGVQIPVEGYVAAGVLTEAISNREYIEVPPSLVNAKNEFFGLRVKGLSMIDECILDGDLVLVKRQATAENGQTVVAMVDDEATLKIYYKRKNHVELHPANPDFAVIHVPAHANFRILGVVSSVIRKLE